MTLTPADIRNWEFSTTRFRPGYDEEEVDAFMDRVEAELESLLRRIAALEAQLGR